MEVEVRHTQGKNQTDLCAYELNQIAELKKSIEGINVEKSVVDSPSKQIREATAELFKQGEWRQSFQFDTTVSDIYPATNYQLDAVLDYPNLDCGHSHRIFVEQCFDNRQAIGTNLLKFELAKSIYERSLDFKSLSLIICADKACLKKFGWDGSIASSEEYENALRGAYNSILKINPVLLVIRN